MRRVHLHGFTILEVMNAAAFTCIVGALAMYFVARYVRHAKTAEAIGSVKLLAESAAGYYDASDGRQPAGTKPEQARAMRHFPPSSHASVPADASDVRGKRYQSARADWLASPWAELRFSIPQPQYYAYSFESEGSGDAAHALAVAQGDLDADGVISRYRLAVRPDQGLLARVATEVERENAEE